VSARNKWLSLRGGLAIASFGAFGCGSSPLVPARIEAALATTFANLVHVQVSCMGLAPMAASDFGVRASCRKLLEGNNAGSGDWVCTILWQGPDRQPLRDTYDVFVTIDGCYTATIEGETLGGPTLRTRDGREVKNLLHTFEGCFDTT
jgi:hypothetical protein